jgi:hypothetical protein
MNFYFTCRRFTRYGAYDLFAEDVNAIVLGDFNLLKIGWSLHGDGVGLMPLNVTTDLKSDLIEGLLSCDLEQINLISQLVGFWALVFSNTGTRSSRRQSPLMNFRWICCLVLLIARQ